MACSKRKSLHVAARAPRSWTLCVALAIVGALAVAPMSGAEDQAPTVCTGMIDGGSYWGIVVPAGATCELYNATVHGDIVAESAAMLNAVGNRVLGDVIADNTMIVQVHQGVVHGSIEISGAGDTPAGTSEVVVGENHVVDGDISVTGSAGTIRVALNMLVDGSIVVADNYVPPFLEYPSSLWVGSNVVRGNIDVLRNAGTGDKGVFWNNVYGTLSCFGNEEPFTGGPNRAATTSGQCF